MDRRIFIKSGTLAFIAARLGGLNIFASERTKNADIPFTGDDDEAVPGPLKIRFLGTGAADWDEKPYEGYHRNHSSILIDNHLLIDFNAMAASMLPDGVHPKTIFYTHSHSDHFNAKDALDLGIERVFLSKTWMAHATGKFEKAASETGNKMPRIIGIDALRPYKVDGITFTALPANHGTSIPGEQTLIYLLEKGRARVLYATDTGGIMAGGAQYAGFDYHCKVRNPLTGLIMESTMGMDYDEDFRLFTHSSAKLVQRTTDMLLEYGLLKLQDGGKVYLTHLAKTLNPSPDVLAKTLPEPLFAAYDGLEVEFS